MRAVSLITSAAGVGCSGSPPESSSRTSSSTSGWPGRARSKPCQASAISSAARASTTSRGASSRRGWVLSILPAMLLHGTEGAGAGHEQHVLVLAPQVLDGEVAVGEVEPHQRARAHPGQQLDV